MDTPIENAAVAATPAPKRRRNHRKARKPFDGRYAIGRRIKQLAITFRERLSLDANPDPLLLTAIERAAQLQALAEQAAARALRADPAVAYDDVVRLSRLADLAVRRLRLDRRDEATEVDRLSGCAWWRAMTLLPHRRLPDLPPHNNPRAVLEHELRRLKALYWADPGDDELLRADCAGRD